VDTGRGGCYRDIPLGLPLDGNIGSQREADREARRALEGTLTSWDRGVRSNPAGQQAVLAAAQPPEDENVAQEDA
jgi:hypothetical protein